MANSTFRYTRWFSFISILLLSLLLMLSGTTSAHAEEEFLSPEQAFVFKPTMQSPRQLQLNFNIAPGYYMYQERFEFKVVSADTEQVPLLNLLGKPQFPLAQIKYDPTFEKDMAVYHDTVSITLELKGQQAFTLNIVGQGCADAGLCYPPITYSVQLSPTSQGYEIIKTANASNATGRTSIISMITGKPVDSNNNIAASHQVISTNTTAATNPGYTELLDASDTELSSWLNEASFLKIVLICFVLGVLLSLTPCVLPMLPILLALLVRNSNNHEATSTSSNHGAITSNTSSPKEPTQFLPLSKYHTLTLTLAYVLGTSIVYTILGIVAASIGAVLAAWIQNPWVLNVFAILLTLLAIALFGAFSFQVPAGTQTWLLRLANSIPGGRYIHSLVLGMISALICSPCVAAPLAGVLLFMSQTGNLLIGGSALFALAWGQGISLIIIGLGSAALLPKAGPWMDAIKNFCGLLLLATALWMISPIIAPWLSVLGWALLAFALAYLSGVFKPAFNNIVGIFCRAIGLIALIWAILLLISIATGYPSLLKPLQGLSTNYSTINNKFNASNNDTSYNFGNTSNSSITHSNNFAPNTTHVQFQRIRSLAELQQILLAKPNKPVMLDFYADWCIACREMEQFTFSNPEVAEQTGKFLLLQVDVTENNPDDRELLQRFKLFGPPGIIFFDKNSQEITKVRVIGFQNAEKFSENLDRVLQGQASQ